MKEYFADILSLEGVHGVLFLSAEAEVLYAEFTSARYGMPNGYDWKALVSSVHHIREADIFYDKLRIYMRKTDSGHLLVIADTTASGAMLRLNCDIALPVLKDPGSRGGLKRFFQKSAPGPYRGDDPSGR